MSNELKHNTRDQQYEFHIDGKVAKITYTQRSQKIYLNHTEVPDAFEGQGIGSELARAVLEDIAEKELALVPRCPFIVHYIKTHPEWQRLLADHVTLSS